MTAYKENRKNQRAFKINLSTLYKLSMKTQELSCRSGINNSKTKQKQNKVPFTLNRHTKEST